MYLSSKPTPAMRDNPTPEEKRAWNDAANKAMTASPRELGQQAILLLWDPTNKPALYLGQCTGEVMLRAGTVAQQDGSEKPLYERYLSFHVTTHHSPHASWTQLRDNDPCIEWLAQPVPPDINARLQRLEAQYATLPATPPATPTPQGGGHAS